MLNKIEHKILSILDQNSRIQSSNIAKTIKTSRQVIDYRIQQLKEKNIIQDCITLIEPFQFVNNIWHTYLKLQSLTNKKEEEIIKYLQTQKQVWWIAKSQGEWDFIFSTAGNSINQLDKTLQNFRTKFSNNITEEQTTTIISVINFPRGYFTNKPTKKQIYIQTKQKEIINKKDISILKILATNARLPATKIAEQTNLTARQVIYKIKKLIKKEIIRTFKIQLNLDKINYDYYKVCFYTHQYTPQEENQIISWCEKNPYANYYIKKIAPWTFEIEFETPSYKELNNTLSKLRNLFGEKIKRTEITIITKEYKGELNILETI